MSNTIKRSTHLTYNQRRMRNDLKENLPKSWLPALNSKTGKEIYTFWKLLDRSRDKNPLTTKSSFDDWLCSSRRKQLRVVKQIAKMNVAKELETRYRAITLELDKVGLSLSSTKEEMQEAPEEVREARNEYMFYVYRLTRGANNARNMFRRRYDNYLKNFPLTTCSTAEDILRAPEWDRKRLALEIIRQSNELVKSSFFDNSVKRHPEFSTNDGASMEKVDGNESN